MTYGIPCLELHKTVNTRMAEPEASVGLLQGTLWPPSSPTWEAVPASCGGQLLSLLAGAGDLLGPDLLGLGLTMGCSSVLGGGEGSTVSA